MIRPCATHAERQTELRCAVCHRWLCDDCLPVVVLGEPACEQCGVGVRTRSLRRAILAAVIGIGGLVAAYVSEPHRTSFRIRLRHADFDFAIASIVAAVALFASSRIHDPHLVVTRAGHARPTSTLASMRRFVTSLAVATLALPLFVPRFFALPLWLELEVALGAYALALVLLLARALYVGRLPDDDHVSVGFTMPWEDVVPGRWQPVPFVTTPADPPPGDSWFVIVTLFVALAAVLPWLLLEAILPLVFGVVYAATHHALRAAAVDHHACEGNLSRSFVHALPIAVAITLPVGALVGLLHAWLRLVHG